MIINVEPQEVAALTKADIFEMLLKQVRLNKPDAKEMVETFFEVISHTLMTGEDVKICGFGNFQVRTKAPRPGRNPRTGEFVPIKARRVVTFHASQKLKEQISP